MEGSEWLAAVKLLGGALGIIVLGVASFFTGKKKAAEPAVLPANQIVAASFTEKSQLDRLISVLDQVNRTVGESTEITERLVELLEEEKQRRHDEAVALRALRERGIVP